MRKQINEPAKIEHTDPLHVKYRPKTLNDVMGQDAIVKSLEKTLASKARPHVFLFTGGSGTGKTTLARILASMFHVEQNNLLEIDAASNTGVDDMRAMMGPLRYNGFGDSPNKAIILDECHRLSKQAWESLLKTIEEPPPHVYFFFCTTEAGKVPDAVVTRSQAYNLKQVKYDDIMELLEYVCDAESFKTPDRFLSMIAQACGGSPRQALVMLAMTHDCEDEEEVARLLETPLDNKEVIDLCRALLKGDLEWAKLTAILKGLNDTPAESIRIIIVNYLNACLMGAKGDRDVPRMLDMLEAFSKPGNPSDKLAPILIAFGKFMYP